MCDGNNHCGECGYFIRIGKADAESVCAALPRVGEWQRYRTNVIMAVAYALKQHGICAYYTELQDSVGVACNQFWVKDVEADVV